jgi:thiamine biosynthesis lipoprotein ApbE
MRKLFRVNYRYTHEVPSQECNDFHYPVEGLICVTVSAENSEQAKELAKNLFVNKQTTPSAFEFLNCKEL